MFRILERAKPVRILEPIDGRHTIYNEITLSMCHRQPWKVRSWQVLGYLEKSLQNVLVHFTICPKFRQKSKTRVAV